MISEILAAVCLVLAAIPAGLFVMNWFCYRAPRSRDPVPGSAVSVLLPARNEEKNIGRTVESVLASTGIEFEIIVLDDHSTDRTASIVSEIARRDGRVRLAWSPSLPPGWCGKPHACGVLAGLARHPILVFLDADVRLAPDALRRMVAFLQESGADLASGVPRQELGTFAERLLIPLIHFILLGFLPMWIMRVTRLPSFSAGCGQLFVARREAYFKSGGHASIRATLHDGLQLPRLFRRRGFRTDLFDATRVAECRMYASAGEVWRGLGKNATEALAAPGTIVPMTVMLLGGQVLPFLLPLLVGFGLSPRAAWMGVVASALAILPRLLAAVTYRQPLSSALLHPIGVLALVIIQWQALFRQLAGRPSEWKGRRYFPAAVPAHQSLPDSVR